jgi:hypothetical protein
MKPLLLLCACALLLAQGAAFGQSVIDVSKSGTVAATFLEIPVGAAAIGLGGAFVSVANDATTLFWNPAGAASFDRNEVVVQHTTWIADTRHDFAAIVMPLGSFGTLGLSFISLSMPDMAVRTIDRPEGTGEFFSAGDLAVGLSYARRLSDRFAIGFTAKYIQESIWHETASAMAIDAGTTFRTDLLGGLTIGASLSNFGTTMQMNGRDTRQFLSVDPTKLGSNDRIPSAIELDSWDLPLLFQFGISTSPVRSEEFRWTVAVDATHPSDDYESVNLGTELAYREFLFLRGGFNSLGLKTAEGGLCLGVGLVSTPLFEGFEVKFDYAFRSMGRLDNVHVIQVGLRF